MRDLAIFLILRYTGMRRESVAALRVRNIDATPGAPQRVRQARGGVPRGEGARGTDEVNGTSNSVFEELLRAPRTWSQTLDEINLVAPTGHARSYIIRGRDFVAR
jgi:hypothetical protein